MNQANFQATYRRAYLASILDLVCQVLELTDTQHERAKGHYEAVGKWLAKGEPAFFEGVSIFPQGSVALGTTIKPLGRSEHDVDLVCFLPGFSRHTTPSLVKQLVGSRLRENGIYKDILEELPRCWRVNYAGDFHLDITPAILNIGCNEGGLLVPDKKMQAWKTSNPKGYQALFERRASLQPRMRLMKAAAFDSQRTIEPFPQQLSKKGILRRTVQIAKHHRDVFFKNQPEMAPISVVITTLAAKSYEHCVAGREYDNEFDLVADVIRLMPEFIERKYYAGQWVYQIPNETTVGENFAEKWNHNAELAEAFYDWHRHAHQSISLLGTLVGRDELFKSMSGLFGQESVKKAFDLHTSEISEAREKGRLNLSPVLGITLEPDVGMRVKPNTFFGAHGENV